MCGFKLFKSGLETFDVLTNILSRAHGILESVQNVFRLPPSELSRNQTLEFVTIDRQYLRNHANPVKSYTGQGENMGVSKNCEKDTNMEMWFLCRFLSPKKDGHLEINENLMESKDEISLDRDIVEEKKQVAEMKSKAAGTEIVSEKEEKGGAEGPSNQGDEDMEAILENGLAEQLASVQEMVVEIKQGFVEVMTELSHLQTTDKKNWCQVEETQDTQQEQINLLQTTVNNLKTDVIGEMRKLLSHHGEMEEKIKELETEREGLLDKIDNIQKHFDSLTYELVRCGTLPDSIRSQVLNGNLELSHPPPWPNKDMSHSNNSKDVSLNGDTDVTSIACKSLSLSQALKEKCMNINLSESSDEDHSHPWQQFQTLDSRSGSSKSRGYHSPRKLSQVDSPDTGPRLHAIEELIQSEKDYCSQIWTILDDYLAPLQERHYLSAREISVLIPPYVGQIYDHHCQILSTLQERVSYWGSNVSIGDIFSRMTDSEEENIMSIYKEYIADIPAAVGCLRRHIAQSRNFKAFIKGQKSRNSESNDILSLMMAPLQRIPRYSLLLQQILKHTSHSHPDHYNLQTSLGKLKSFVDQFNSEMSNTMMALNSEHPRRDAHSFRSSASGSSCDAGHISSTRDSGIHSNGGGDRSSRLPENIDRGNFLPEWIEQSSGYLDQDTGRTRDVYREVHRLKLAARSQPDLSSYNKTYSRRHHLLDSHHRNVDSLSSLHHADNKFKRPRSRRQDTSEGLLVNKRPVSISHNQVIGLRESTYVNSPRARPASAIDFMLPSTDKSRQRGNRDHLLYRPHTSLGPLTRDNNSRIPNSRSYDNYNNYEDTPKSTSYTSREPSQHHVTHQGDANRQRDNSYYDGHYYDNNAVSQYPKEPSEQYQNGDQYQNGNGISQYHADIEDEDDTAVHTNEDVHNMKINYHDSPHDIDYTQHAECLNPKNNYDVNSFNNSERANSDISQEDIDKSTTRSLRLDDIHDPVLNSTEREIEGESGNPPPQTAHHMSHNNISELSNSDNHNENNPIDESNILDMTINPQSQSICIPGEFELRKNLENKKKKKQTKRYTSLEHIPMSDDDSQARRRQTIKSSLKNLFSKKKGSVRMDDLEAEFAKEQKRLAATLKANQFPPNGVSRIQPTDNSRLAALRSIRPYIFTSIFNRDSTGCVKV